LQRLSKKVALVTGGASGLGKAIAQRLRADGATVVISDVQAEVGMATASEIDCHYITQDVTDESRWAGVVHDIRERHGGLHILVNNAGITGPMDAVNPQDVRLSDWRKVFAVNVESVLLGCKVAIPAMHASGGGSIINISSIAAFMATPYGTAYGASKAVVRQLTKSVAQHCAEKRLNIRCNSVHPGNVRTPLWDKQALENAQLRGVPFEEIVRENQCLIPMGDFTRPEDVAAAVAFLASEDSRHMTGTKLVIDGGFTYCDSYRPRQ